jgi:hypothetical protein
LNKAQLARKNKSKYYDKVMFSALLESKEQKVLIASSHGRVACSVAQASQAVLARSKGNIDPVTASGWLCRRLL